MNCLCECKTKISEAENDVIRITTWIVEAAGAEENQNLQVNMIFMGKL